MYLQIVKLIGAGAFGAMIGWYVYYINRYRKSDVQLGDITTLVGVLGGGTATALFAPSGELFGAYGIGLFTGFFGYFLSLVYLVDKSSNFDADWFLDGRRKRPIDPFYIPNDVASTTHPMDVRVSAQQSRGEAEPSIRPSQQREMAPALPQAGSGPSDLSQEYIDRCVALKLEGAADLQALFFGNNGFIPWYNQTLSSQPEFRHRGQIRTTDIVKRRFDMFWDQIPGVFGSAQITMVEFCALMCIGIQENTGDLWSNPEKVGTAGHPGLAYAFDKIPGKKQSYNHANGNWTALKLFKDASYLSAHQELPGADRVLRTGPDLAWEGESWPVGFPTDEDASINGFVMEADFYKFRGRGIIQTTGRADYCPLIQFILTDVAAKGNPALVALATAWNEATRGKPDQINAIASISSNHDWDGAFGETSILAAGIRIDSEGKGKYLNLSHDAAVLNAGINTKGSLYFMARKINGGSYPDQVVPMMKAMIAAVARANAPMAEERLPRDLT